MADRRMKNVTIENARTIWRNFSGEERQYNREGDRNFAVILPEDVARQMQSDGWNVKYKEPTAERAAEGQEPIWVISVTVSYKAGTRHPNAFMITKNGTKRTRLNADTVGMLDQAIFKNVDVIIRPYEWEVNGNTGVKAYLDSLYATLEENELDLKYADLDEAGSSRNAEPNREENWRD